jgi:hypothetical protein
MGAFFCAKFHVEEFCQPDGGPLVLPIIFQKPGFSENKA